MDADGAFGREGGSRRRRRRRATSAQGAPPPAPSPSADPAPPPAPPPAAPKAAPSESAAEQAPARGKSPRRRRAPRENNERGLRDLVGSGPSQLGVSGALRGRDVNRPTAEDIAEAERDLQIVRRNWQPSDKR
jgi:hypothetical protein